MIFPSTSNTIKQNSLFHETLSFEMQIHVSLLTIYDCRKTFKNKTATVQIPPLAAGIVHWHVLFFISINLNTWFFIKRCNFKYSLFLPVLSLIVVQFLNEKVDVKKTRKF